MSQLPTMNDPCKTCGVLISRKHMERHMKVHLETSVSCHICNKNFKTQNSLWQHKKTHEEPEMISCNICSSKFQSKSALRKHVLRIHERITYSCPYSQKSFSDERYCQKHISTCALSNPVECGKCYKIFQNNTSLTAHMKIHAENECSFL